MDKPNKCNENLREFLVGEWDNYAIGVPSVEPIETESYNEKFIIKDNKTMSIDHDCFGQWETVEMGLDVEGDKVTMTQGDLVIKGHREGNTYYLSGVQDGKKVKFKLYTFGDKFIQLREYLDGENVTQVDFSTLTRKESKKD